MTNAMPGAQTTDQAWHEAAAEAPGAFQRYLYAHLDSLISLAAMLREYATVNENKRYRLLLQQARESTGHPAEQRIPEELGAIETTIRSRMQAEEARAAGQLATATEIELRNTTWLRRCEAGRAVLRQLGCVGVTFNVRPENGALTLTFRQARTDETEAVARRFVAEWRRALRDPKLRRRKARTRYVVIRPIDEIGTVFEIQLP